MSLGKATLSRTKPAYAGTPCDSCWAQGDNKRGTPYKSLKKQLQHSQSSESFTLLFKKNPSPFETQRLYAVFTRTRHRSVRTQMKNIKTYTCRRSKVRQTTINIHGSVNDSPWFCLYNEKNNNGKASDVVRPGYHPFPYLTDDSVYGFEPFQHSYCGFSPLAGTDMCTCFSM